MNPPFTSVFPTVRAYVQFRGDDISSPVDGTPVKFFPRGRDLRLQLSGAVVLFWLYVVVVGIHVVILTAKVCDFAGRVRVWVGFSGLD